MNQLIVNLGICGITCKQELSLIQQLKYENVVSCFLQYSVWNQGIYLSLVMCVSTNGRDVKHLFVFGFRALGFIGR